jgi:amino acid permease
MKPKSKKKKESTRKNKMPSLDELAMQMSVSYILVVVLMLWAVILAAVVYQKLSTLKMKDCGEAKFSIATFVVAPIVSFIIIALTSKDWSK